MNAPNKRDRDGKTTVDGEFYKIQKNKKKKMGGKNESESEREIIQVRRIVPKPKTANQSVEEELKAKAAELKRRVFRTQLALGAGVALFLFLGFRDLGCFQNVAPFDAKQTPPFAPTSTRSDANANSNAVAVSNAAANGTPRADAPTSEPSARNAVPDGFGALRVVRVATWNLGDFNFAKLSDANIGDKTAKAIQEFDVVALQGIRAKNLAVLDGLAYLIVKNGGDYSYVASKPGRRDKTLAIFFNAKTVDVDRSRVSEVVDSRGRLAIPSLVAAFRSATVDAARAFTFQIVNCDLTDSPRPDGAALVDVYQTLRGRAGALGVAEDDLLLVGDFGVAIQKLDELGDLPNFVAIHADKTTDVDGRTSANCLFDSIATTEYVERFGIVDLSEYFDISEEEAATVAKGRPLWADFSVFEGGDAQFSAPTSASETATNRDVNPFGDVDVFR